MRAKTARTCERSSSEQKSQIPAALMTAYVKTVECPRRWSIASFGKFGTADFAKPSGVYLSNNPSGGYRFIECILNYCPIERIPCQALAIQSSLTQFTNDRIVVCRPTNKARLPIQTVVFKQKGNRIFTIKFSKNNHWLYKIATVHQDMTRFFCQTMCLLRANFHLSRRL